jgi:hypothetical protein
VDLVRGRVGLGAKDLIVDDEFVHIEMWNTASRLTSDR